MLRLWRHLLWFTWSSIYMSILEGKSYNYVALMAEKPNNHKGETKVRTATAIFQSILVESNKLNDHGNHLHEYYVQS